jgi:Domain of unknown function (DUF4160)
LGPDGVKIAFYANEHSPAHFHTMIAEHRAVFDIAALTITAGSSPPSNRDKVRSSAESCKGYC